MICRPMSGRAESVERSESFERSAEEYAAWELEEVEEAEAWSSRGILETV